jgi:hypothetical protein
MFRRLCAGAAQDLAPLTACRVAGAVEWLLDSQKGMTAARLRAVARYGKCHTELAHLK